MSDLHNRNAKVFEQALIEYRDAALKLTDTVNAQQAALSSAMARIQQLEQNFAVMRIMHMGRGSTTE